SPTGTCKSAPVERTSSPSEISRYSPRMITPTEFSSRLKARPRTLVRVNSTISPDMTPESPYTRAMPSPTSSTRPTSRTSSLVLYCSISVVRTEAISLALNLMTASHDDLIADVGEFRAHGSIVLPVADADADTADHFGLDSQRQYRFAMQEVRKVVLQALALIVGQGNRGGHRHAHTAGALVAQRP